ncbi:aldehyde dehydrogenase family protein, partial [Stutzerimonas balearica]
MTTLTLADWQQRARDLHIEGRAFIQGRYTPAAKGEVFDCISPVDGRLLTQVASCDEADAEQAVASARAAFDSGVWSRMAPARRKAVLVR